MTILQIYCVQRIGPANPHWAIYYFKAIVHNPNQVIIYVKISKEMINGFLWDLKRILSCSKVFFHNTKLSVMFTILLKRHGPFVAFF